MKIIALALALSIAGGAAALAAGSPFDGTWVMDPARSKLAGDTIRFTKTAAGYRYSNGGPMTYSFAPDGKPYPMALPGQTAAWTQTPDGFDIVYRNHGEVLTSVHRVMSPDGAKMTSTYTEHRPDGTTVTETDVYTRVSGSTGLAGTWRSVAVKAAGDRMIIATPKPGAFRLEAPASKEVIEGRLDGSHATAVGPTVPAGAYAVYKEVSPGKWTYQAVLKGKVFYEGEMAVSPDGATLTDMSWIPGRRSEAATAIYTR